MRNVFSLKTLFAGVEHSVCAISTWLAGMWEAGEGLRPIDTAAQLNKSDVHHHTNQTSPPQQQNTYIGQGGTCGCAIVVAMAERALRNLNL